MPKLVSHSASTYKPSGYPNYYAYALIDKYTTRGSPLFPNFRINQLPQLSGTRCRPRKLYILRQISSSILIRTGDSHMFRSSKYMFLRTGRLSLMMKCGGLVHRLRKISLLVTLLLPSVLLSVIAASAQKPLAELPRVYIDTTWNEPSGGKTWRVHTSADLSNALAKSAPGDVIVLDAGVTYAGNFKVPSKLNPNKRWIYVISSAYSSLPKPGIRVAPTDAANMPKIVSPNVGQALSFADGANRWRFVGIEVYSASTYKPKGYPNFYAYALIDKTTYPSVSLPDSIVFDRVYVHGDSTHDVQRAISANFSNTALLDSYISDIHMAGTDTQAYGVWESPGPFKVVNNHLEAAGENVMLGGAGGSNNAYIPSDIEVRGNYIYKPLSWVPLSRAPINSMVVKNSFELKSAQRVLFENNTIENCWMAGQAGFAVVLTVRTSQSGDIAVVNDITITNNILKNVTAGFNSLTVSRT